MFLKIKTFLADILGSARFGRFIAWLFNNQIPCWRYGNLSFDCSSPHITDVIKASIFWGVYEGSEIRFAQKYLNSELDVVELGGSIGILSSHIAPKIAPKRLFSVEAWPNMERIIRTNWAKNGVLNAHLIVKAIGAPDEKLYFTKGDYNATGTVSNFFEKETIEIDSISLSQLLIDNKIEDFVLISDIEGSEISFILKDPESLKNCQLIIMETHEVSYNGQIYTTEFMKTRIESLGFQLIDRHGVNLVFRKIG
jgi:FkbM family methyltransferase